MTELTIKEKLIIVAILVAIMDADGVTDPNEIKYLDSIISEFRLDFDQLSQTSDMDLNVTLDLFRQFDTAKKEYAKRLFKEMAASDGYLHPSELAIIESL